MTLGLALSSSVAADEPPKVQAGADGFAFGSSDGAWKLRFYGYAQADGRFALSDDSEVVSNSFLIRRVRPSLQVVVGKKFEATVVPDFGGGGFVLQDAYIDVKRSAAVRLRAGKFKVPFGLERLQSGAQLVFVERSLANGLVPNRDVGLQLFGEAGLAQYALAVVNGAPDGGSADGDSNDAKDLAARVFFKPFKKSKGAIQGLSLGVAATTGTQKGSLPVQRSTAQATYFQYATGVTADGSRFRISPQASFTTGPFGLFAEYARTEQRVRRAAVAEMVATSGWEVTAAWLITGEKQSFGWVAPKAVFDPEKGGKGA